MKTSLITTLAAPNATESSPSLAGIILTTFAGSSKTHFLTVLLSGSNSRLPAFSIPPPMTTISGLNKFTRYAILMPVGLMNDLYAQEWRLY